jgi:hypothetical protein
LRQRRIGETAPQGSTASQIVEFLLFNSTVARAVGIAPIQTGSANLEMTCGNVHKTFPITVTP